MTPALQAASVAVAAPASLAERGKVDVQDTVTGFLLAGIGNVDLRKRSNFLVVTDSKQQALS